MTSPRVAAFAPSASKVRFAWAALTFLSVVVGCDPGPSEASRLAACLRDAQASVDAVQRRDVEAMTRSLHPAALTNGIGIERVRASVRNLFAEMDREQSHFESVKLTPPARTFAGGTRRFALVDQASVVVFRKSLRIAADSYLLGISEDDGQTWRFIDASGLKKMDVTKVLPEYPIAQHPLPVKPSPSVTLADVRAAKAQAAAGG